MSKASGFKISKGGIFENLKVRKTDEIAVVNTSEFQAPTEGGLLYEPVLQQVHYADGTQWLPIGGTGSVTSVGAGIGLNGTPNPITTAGIIDLADTAVTPGTYGDVNNIPQYTVDQQGRMTFSANIPLSTISGLSSSFSLIKSGTQNILPTVFTILTNWTNTPSPPYHDNTGEWNLGTGIYKASQTSTLYINLSLSWAGGISNLGNRTCRIIYKPSAGVQFTAKEFVTQADPDTAVATTQELSISLQLATNDEVWIEVSHTSPVNLTVSSGNTTTIAGVKITG